MRLLLDTHALLWWLADDERLPATCRAAVADAANDVYVSAATAWEIATKVRLGKLPGAEALATDIAAKIAAEQFSPLAVEVTHAQRAGALPFAHRDPFDRMLVAQALAEDLVLVSNEALFDACGVRRLW
ncbi:MAG: type II toxin-antitoxin system VapC family toxin [Myxococcales bacterium]|nr:type II toxin-antitoxin system VapC family toxin [Myxococcales bacterium]